MLSEKSKVVKGEEPDTPPPNNEELEILMEQLSAYGIEAQIRFSKKAISLGVVDEMEETLCMTLKNAKKIDKALTFDWLGTHIARVNELVNVAEKNKMNKTQQDFLAASILNYMEGLNLIEICVFFARLREGRYGEFYNRFDNSKFEKWRASFMAELNNEIAEYQAAMEPIRRKAEEEERRIRGERWLETMTAKGFIPSGTSIEERIRRNPKFFSSKRRTEDEDSTPPALPAGGTKTDTSRDAYMKTLKETFTPEEYNRLCEAYNYPNNQ